MCYNIHWMCVCTFERVGASLFNYVCACRWMGGGVCVRMCAGSTR